MEEQTLLLFIFIVIVLVFILMAYLTNFFTKRSTKGLNTGNKKIDKLKLLKELVNKKEYEEENYENTFENIAFFFSKDNAESGFFKEELMKDLKKDVLILEIAENEKNFAYLRKRYKDLLPNKKQKFSYVVFANRGGYFNHTLTLNFFVKNEVLKKIIRSANKYGKVIDLVELNQPKKTKIRNNDIYLQYLNSLTQEKNVKSFYVNLQFYLKDLLKENKTLMLDLKNFKLINPITKREYSINTKKEVFEIKENYGKLSFDFVIDEDDSDVFELVYNPDIDDDKYTVSFLMEAK